MFFDNPVGPIKSVTVAPMSANSSCITAMIFSSLSGTPLPESISLMVDYRDRRPGTPPRLGAKIDLVPVGAFLGLGRVYRLLVWSALDVVL